MGNQESIPNNSFIVRKVNKKDVKQVQQIKQTSSNKNKQNINLQYKHFRLIIIFLT